MSDDWLIVIPSDPEYVPNPAIQQMAFALFSSFVGKADDLSILETETVEFISPGENWESVTCPACGANLSEWWQQAAEAAYANEFSDLMVQVPCCGAQGSLNDLIYSWPAGFARFRLQARNPTGDVNDTQLSLLSNVMKGELRIVRARI